MPAPLRVAVDDQIFTVQHRGGIARIFTELVHELRAAPELGIEVRTPFRYVLNEHLLELDPARYRRPRLPDRLVRGRVLRAMNRLLVRSDWRDVDLVHHTYYFADALERPARRRVCTIYDMIPELLPELIPPGATPHQAKAAYVEQCDAILCISESTRADVLRIYGELDKPVVATPLGAGDAFFRAAPPATPGPPYVLFVGQRFAYKDFDVLARAFSLLAPTHPDLRLVCVGGPPFGDDEQQAFADLGIAARVERRFVDDDELPGVYAAARCLVFPSRYEGFGLPIVEAFAAGCPVVVADMPCSVEVGGDAALFIPPGDADALASHLERLTSDDAERARRVEAGRVRARDFTWAATTRRTAEVYGALGRV